MKKLTSPGRRPFWFRLLTLSFTSASLLSGTAFAQKYQETNLVSNTSQSGVTTVDPDLVNCWGISRVDVFSPEGQLLLRLERGSWFNAPWGLVQASTDFGAFSHSIVVGQFGSGEILAFDSVTGAFQGKFEDQNGKVISIPGL
jgi:hypothetical protein